MICCFVGDMYVVFEFFVKVDKYGLFLVMYFWCFGMCLLIGCVLVKFVGERLDEYI